MPTIRVDDEVWGWLKGLARPLEDTPNTVLRRVAGLDERAGAEATPQKRGRTGRKTPQTEYREPLLRILAARGGKGRRLEVLDELERVMDSQLTDFDRDHIRSGTIRWQKSAEWEVSVLRQAGFLVPRNDSPHGEWHLTQAGFEEAKRHARA